MNKLQCEICGGTLIMENGIAVCEFCGMKFTKEEVKKMVIELKGSVKIDGPVQVEGMENADTLYQRGQDFERIGMQDKARDTYQEMADKYPADWRAWMELAALQPLNLEVDSGFGFDYYICPQCGFELHANSEYTKNWAIKPPYTHPVVGSGKGLCPKCGSANVYLPNYAGLPVHLRAKQYDYHYKIRNNNRAGELFERAMNLCTDETGRMQIQQKKMQYDTVMHKSISDKMVSKVGSIVEDFKEELLKIMEQEARRQRDLQSAKSTLATQGFFSAGRRTWRERVENIEKDIQSQNYPAQLQAILADASKIQLSDDAANEAYRQAWNRVDMNELRSIAEARSRD